MAFDQVSPVFQAAVAFDCGEYEAAEKAEYVDGEGEQGGLPAGEGGDPP